MDWKLLDIKQNTDCPFLNHFTFLYEVRGKKHPYHVASRKDKEHLRVYTKSNEPDGVILLLKGKKNGEVAYILTNEFRPAFGRVFTSIPAGLLENGEDIIEAARREGKEEVGVEITNAKLLIAPSSNSEGLSDEMCAVISADIASFEKATPEEFEDISSSLYTIEEIKKMLDDPTRIFPLPCRILLSWMVDKYEK